MEQFSVDKNKCTGCGLCERECGLKKVISVNDGKAQYNPNSSDCIECLHCFKVCPNSAITYHGNSTVQATVYNPGDRVSALLMRRSCRAFKEKPLDRALLTTVINEANTAPWFDISFDERKFIVVDDPEKLGGVRSVVLGQIDKVRKLFSILVKIPFFPKRKKKEYRMIINLFEKILENNKVTDSLFHGAPALVMVAGQKSKTVAKDNSLYAMSQFLIAAEEKHLGTCINGFVSFFSKAVQKYLGMSNDYMICGGAVVGYPVTHFTRHMVRNDSAIAWN